jgi:hypothetical protein
MGRDNVREKITLTKRWSEGGETVAKEKDIAFLFTYIYSAVGF